MLRRTLFIEKDQPKREWPTLAGGRTAFKLVLLHFEELLANNVASLEKSFARNIVTIPSVICFYLSFTQYIILIVIINAFQAR